VDYRAPGVCEFIESGGPLTLTIEGVSFLEQPYDIARAWFAARDPEVDESGTGLTSRRFGIALYAPEVAKNQAARVEGVAVFERGYYERAAQEQQRRLAEMAKRYGVKIRRPPT
jgi:hypothetical protein